MPYVLGVDEAGYGPNLGPLAIAATAWRVPRGTGPEKLYAKLGKVVRAPCSAESGEVAAPGDDSAAIEDDRLTIGDSKQLYKAGGPLESLERGVHAALGLVDRPAPRWRDIWPRLDGQSLAAIENLPWHAGYDEPLPTGPAACDPGRLAVIAEGLKKANVGLADMAATMLFPGPFNDLLDRYDNKAEVLSITSLALVVRMLESLPHEPVIVACDKHGGRGYYAALLQHFFPDVLVQIRRETPDLAVYVLEHAGRSVEFRFLAKGERIMPIALASMTAKYLRELAMRPFNAFWQRHVDGLKPTAGYPTDAKRFWDAIRPAQQKLGIDDRLVWRAR